MLNPGRLFKLKPQIPLGSYIPRANGGITGSLPVPDPSGDLIAKLASPLAPAPTVRDWQNGNARRYGNASTSGRGLCAECCCADESDLPTERTKAPLGVKVKNPGGSETEIPMLPGDAAYFRYKAERDKAEVIARQTEVERRERETQEKREDKAFGSVQEWEAARTKARQIIPTYEKSMQQIDRSIAKISQQIDPYKGNYDTSELLKTKQNLEKRRIDAEVKLGEARAVYQTPKPKVFTPSRSNKNPKRNRTYTNLDIDRIISQ